MDEVTARLFLAEGWQSALASDNTPVYQLSENWLKRATGFDVALASRVIEKEMSITPDLVPGKGDSYIQLPADLFEIWQEEATKTLRTPKPAVASSPKIQPFKDLLKHPQWENIIHPSGQLVWRLPLEGESLQAQREAGNGLLPLFNRGIKPEIIAVPGENRSYIEIGLDLDARRLFEKLIPESVLKKSLPLFVDDSGTARSARGSSREQLQDGLVLKTALPALTKEKALILAPKIVEAITADTASHNVSGAVFAGAITTKDGHLILIKNGDASVIQINYSVREQDASAQILGKENHTPSKEPKIFCNDEQIWVEWDNRVYVTDDTEIAVNHSFGDRQYRHAVSQIAEIGSYNTGVSTDKTRKFAVVMSDGALHKATAGDYAHIVKTELNQNPQASLVTITDKMMKFAKDSKSPDDITIALVELKGKTAIIAVPDGHSGIETAVVCVNEINQLAENAKAAGNWELDKVFAHRAKREPVVVTPREETEQEKTYREAWSLLSPERQQFCFSNLVIAEECKVLHSIFAAKAEEFGTGKPVLQKFKEEGYNNKYLFSAMLRDMLLKHTPAEAVDQLNQVMDKFTKVAQKAKRLTSPSPEAGIVF